MKQEDVTTLSITLIPGSVAPRYNDEDKELVVNNVVITERGMESGLPLIDLQMVDKDGKLHYAALSGRIINMVSSAIKGVNLRNHGIEEP